MELLGFNLKHINLMISKDLRQFFRQKIFVYYNVLLSEVNKFILYD